MDSNEMKCTYPNVKMKQMLHALRAIFSIFPDTLSNGIMVWIFTDLYLYLYIFHIF